jgi:hypothetical protein
MGCVSIEGIDVAHTNTLPLYRQGTKCKVVNKKKVAMIRGPGVVRGRSVGNTDERVKRRRGYDWHPAKGFSRAFTWEWEVDAGP